MAGLFMLVLVSLLLTLQAVYSADQVYYSTVAMDRTGTVIYSSNTAGIYVSMNSGVTWTLGSNSCGTVKSLDISNNGQYAMAVYDPIGPCGAIIVSRNYGLSWTKASLPVKAVTLLDGDVSGSGQYMVTANLSFGNGQDEIYVSSDYGNTFHAVPKTDCINLYSTVMNQAGDKIYVGQSTGLLFLSKDQGTTFSPVNSQGSFSTLACDKDCNYMLASTTNGVNWSSNGGVSWNATNNLPRGNSYHTSLSDDAHYQFAVGYHQNIYRSQDYGYSWDNSNNSPLSNWASVDCDASGQHVVASSVEKGVFLSSDFGVTWALQSV